ncbi:MAG: GNAT family N-acetyltransferase [Chloroflexota bacterium]
MPTSITRLAESDRTDWEALYHGYATFYKMSITPEGLNTVWSWIFDEVEPFYALGARDEDGTLIGLMHYREMPSPLRGTKLGFLDDLYVSPEKRGSGAVDALFARLEEDAKARGWPAVRWITGDDNYRGRGVYDKVATRTMWITYQMDIG